jgi:hypothetical protein
MTKRISGLCLGVAALVFLSAPTAASAQTTGDVLHACYIPLIGVVYRIKAPGLPVQCLSKYHVEFQWNAQGPKGDRGETGAAGNLGLAGQKCPTGYFLTGFTASGALTCNNVNGEEVPPAPIPPVTSALEGLWTFASPLSLRCNTQPLGVNVSYTASGMTTSISSAGHLFATLFGSVSTSLGTSQGDLGIVDMGIPPTPLTFPLSISGSGAFDPRPPLGGSVSYTFSGAFTSANSLSTSLSVSANGLVISLVGIGIVDLACTPVSANITATK